MLRQGNISILGRKSKSLNHKLATFEETIYITKRCRGFNKLTALIQPIKLAFQNIQIVNF